jgi:hypothetical protein
MAKRTVKVRAVRRGLSTSNSQNWTVLAHDSQVGKLSLELGESEVADEDTFVAAIRKQLGNVDVEIPEETPGWFLPWQRETDPDAPLFNQEERPMGKPIFSEAERRDLLSLTAAGQSVLNAERSGKGWVDLEHACLLQCTELGRAALSYNLTGARREGPSGCSASAVGAGASGEVLGGPAPAAGAEFASSSSAGDPLFKPGEREELLRATSLGQQVLAAEAQGSAVQGRRGRGRNRGRGTASTGSGYSQADAGVPSDGTGPRPDRTRGDLGYGSGHGKQRGSDQAVASSTAVGRPVTEAQGYA